MDARICLAFVQRTQDILKKSEEALNLQDQSSGNFNKHHEVSMKNLGFLWKYRHAKLQNWLNHVVTQQKTDTEESKKGKPMQEMR